MEAVLDDPLILLIDRRVSDMKGLLPVLERVAQKGRSLLVVAEATLTEIEEPNRDALEASDAPPLM